jgi:hypothetical protein
MRAAPPRQEASSAAPNAIVPTYLVNGGWILYSFTQTG